MQPNQVTEEYISNLTKEWWWWWWCKRSIWRKRFPCWPFSHHNNSTIRSSPPTPHSPNHNQQCFRSSAVVNAMQLSPNANPKWRVSYRVDSLFLHCQCWIVLLLVICGANRRSSHPSSHPIPPSDANSNSRLYFAFISLAEHFNVDVGRDWSCVLLIELIHSMKAQNELNAKMALDLTWFDMQKSIKQKKLDGKGNHWWWWLLLHRST